MKGLPEMGSICSPGAERGKKPLLRASAGQTWVAARMVALPVYRVEDTDLWWLGSGWWVDCVAD